MKAMLFSAEDLVRITGNSRDYGASNLSKCQGECGEVVGLSDALYVVQLDDGSVVRALPQDLQLAVS